MLLYSYFTSCILGIDLLVYWFLLNCNILVILCFLILGLGLGSWGI